MIDFRLFVVAALVAPTGAIAACSSTVLGSGTAVRCAAVFFGVPGSGQGIRNPAPGRVPAGVRPADARRFGTSVGRLEAELEGLAGDRLATAVAIDYPALPVDRYLSVLGLSPDLNLSETSGVDALVAAIRAAQRGGRQSRPVLLSGYSQGAEVVTRAVDALEPAERAHVAVALLGNPSHSSGLRPTFLNGAAYSLPPDVGPRATDICAPLDPVCGVDPSLSNIFSRVRWVLDHVGVHTTAYAFGTPDYAGVGARFLWAHRS